MDSSPAQRHMARRLKAALPVANTLLEPCVVTDVLVKLRHRRQVSKFIYDKSAKDLPELRVGETVRMKPLPGDRTGLWRLGSCVQKVAPRSYLVEVNGSLYRRHRVDLRIAEPAPTQNPDGQRGRMTKDGTPANHMGPEALGEEPGDHRSSHMGPDALGEEPGDHRSSHMGPEALGEEPGDHRSSHMGPEALGEEPGDHRSSHMGPEALGEEPGDHRSSHMGPEALGEEPGDHRSSHMGPEALGEEPGDHRSSHMGPEALGEEPGDHRSSHMGPEALGEEPGDHRSAAPSPINTPLRQSGDTPVREPAVLADKPPVFSHCGLLSQPKILNLTSRTHLLSTNQVNVERYGALRIVTTFERRMAIQYGAQSGPGVPPEAPLLRMAPPTILSDLHRLLSACHSNQIKST
ncbi:uncharacterized protein ACWYII_045479 [Salvelinus alpinus]